MSLVMNKISLRILKGKMFCMLNNRILEVIILEVILFDTLQISVLYLQLEKEHFIFNYTAIKTMFFGKNIFARVFVPVFN